MRASMRSRAKNGRISAALVLSYVFDWAIIIVSAGFGAWFSTMTPNMRPFSLTNPEISFPHQTKEKISTVMLAMVALPIPAGIIFLVCLFLVPGPTVSKSTPKALIWRRKLWEWHAGWLGLALSLASAFLITNGMKNLFGKPRPDLISRCLPDLDNIASNTIKGYANTLVDFHVVYATICTQQDKSLLNDGFRSFPSGHASFSSAGLIYLSLFLASKLAITLPFLVSGSDESRLSAFPSRAERNAAEKSISHGTMTAGDQLAEPTGHNDAIISARNQAAAPPVYLLLIAAIPTFASIYIASTRYSDFRHHGFDILSGYFIGAVTSIFAFRYYHLPISAGAGWSWGPRSRDRSFWVGVGVGNYVGSNKNIVTEMNGGMNTDLETGITKIGTTNDVGVKSEGSERAV